MRDIENYIRNSKINNILICILILTVCIINILVNKNIYNGILFDNYKQIKTIEELNNYKNDKIIQINLNDSKIEKYSTIIKKDKYNIYTLNLDNRNILILLKDNTVLTSKTKLKITDDNYIIKDIKNKMKNNNYYDITLSNINLKGEILFQTIKLYIVVILSFIQIVQIILDIIFIINPKYTKMYKSYLKKL